jgi:aconitate hydratase
METHQTQAVLHTEYGNYQYFRLSDIAQVGLRPSKNLPFAIKILLENALRNCDGFKVTIEDIKKIAAWTPKNLKQEEIAFCPGRVILQDFTGVPCVVDLAAMRSAVKRLGGDISKINPLVRCDLIIDHSVQMDAYGCAEAFAINMEKEFERNAERYGFLKWGQNVFQNFSVIPPGTGIIHQVNLEYLAQGVLKKEISGKTVIYPDSVVGTDSHTTMINGLGIIGWGVGGIEAEAVMLGEPITMLLPEVVGFRLTGKMKEGVTATDVVLTIVEMLRKKGVVGKFVEYYGPGLKHLSLPDRAMIANMAPEYGATTGLFPIDETTLAYYAMTGRDPKQVDLIERYARAQGMFYSGEDDASIYSSMVELDLSAVQPCVAGPKRPQDRIVLSDVKDRFNAALSEKIGPSGFGLSLSDAAKMAKLKSDEVLSHGSVVIASITSCTNTSDPSVLIGAGLVAKKAVRKGLNVPSFVKTSFAPGSQVVEEYLKAADLLDDLERLGFHIAGYGCATCIGNSGPLADEIASAIDENNIIAASVLSGNRNFEGRVNPYTKANYLASPPLVVAYALAGRINIDFNTEAIGNDPSGNKIFLKDIWPTDQEIYEYVNRYVTAESFRKRYKNISAANEKWNAIAVGKDSLFSWNEKSTYIQEPPFFHGMTKVCGKLPQIRGAHVLLKVGDSITTDHISPAGSIGKNSPAGKYLQSLGVDPKDFNSYGSRRGNDRVMVRGTFANIRLRNQLVPESEGSWTIHFSSGEEMSIFDASEKYRAADIPLVILAGKEYGTGSSRDWAAKGPALLGVRVVIAESYERIHRSNLAGMGILPLQYISGESADSLGLNGDETFDLVNIEKGLVPSQKVTVQATRPDGTTVSFQTICRLDTPVEIEYFKNGGILQTVMRKIL